MSARTECKELGANFRRLGRQTGVPRVHAHRFRHTFATGAIENQARDLDAQYLLGHSILDMVRRYSATYNSEKAARAHEAFSPADRLKERLRGVDTASIHVLGGACPSARRQEAASAAARSVNPHLNPL